MSNKNRVNPDHYKVAGRDAQGEDFTPELHRQRFGREAARLRGWGTANFIPGAAPVGEAPADGKGNAGMGMQASAKRGVKSTSQKQESSRHGTAPSPQAAAIPGAFGKERENGRASARGARRTPGKTTRRRAAKKTGARTAAAKTAGARKSVGRKTSTGKAGTRGKAGSRRRAAGSR